MLEINEVLTVIAGVRTVFGRLFDGQNVSCISDKLFATSGTAFRSFFIVIIIIIIILTVYDDVRNRRSTTLVHQSTIPSVQNCIRPSPMNST